VRITRTIQKGKNRVDRTLLVLILVLTSIGLVAVADASAPQALNFFADELYFFKQQAIWAFFGVILLIGVSFIKYNFWERIATPLFLINLSLLVLVLIPGLGISALGARRWIDLGALSFQPSELIKLSFILYLAKVASRSKGALSYFLPLVAVSVLIMFQPDLGTTLVIAGVALLQIFIAGINLFYFMAAGMAGLIAAVILVLSSSYRRSRLATFLESTNDPLGDSYHIRQILLALGSGGFLGVGLGASRQKYLFLPEAATDSIFAVLAEELGFIGAFVLLVIFAMVILRGLKIARSAPDQFSKVASIGITAWIGLQVFLNIGSMVAIVPLTGVPLPFISYGGTALTTLLFATGILLNISRYVP